MFVRPLPDHLLLLLSQRTWPNSWDTQLKHAGPLRRMSLVLVMPGGWDPRPSLGDPNECPLGAWEMSGGRPIPTSSRGSKGDRDGDSECEAKVKEMVTAVAWALGLALRSEAPEGTGKDAEVGRLAITEGLVWGHLVEGWEAGGSGTVNMIPWVSGVGLGMHNAEGRGLVTSGQWVSGRLQGVEGRGIIMAGQWVSGVPHPSLPPDD
ncbi:hypothetical protein C8Q74DRAFT_1222754 [Fomes fomentarius]|nr:hypothetical protein C8Q74DRAFT_1222754 [Fomes fomentarius]